MDMRGFTGLSFCRAASLSDSLWLLSWDKGVGRSGRIWFTDTRWEDPRLACVSRPSSICWPVAASECIFSTEEAVVCLPMSLIPCCRTPVNYEVRTNIRPLSCTAQQADNRLFLFWDQDSNNVILYVNKIHLKPLWTATKSASDLLGHCTERRHGSSSITQLKETKRIKEWKQESDESLAMWARWIRGNSERGSNSSSFLSQWERDGCLLHIEREEAADKELWRPVVFLHLTQRPGNDLWESLLSVQPPVWIAACFWNTGGRWNGRWNARLDIVSWMSFFTYWPKVLKVFPRCNFHWLRESAYEICRVLLTDVWPKC